MLSVLQREHITYREPTRLSAAEKQGRSRVRRDAVSREEREILQKRTAEILGGHSIRQEVERDLRQDQVQESSPKALHHTSREPPGFHQTELIIQSQALPGQDES